MTDSPDVETLETLLDLPDPDPAEWEAFLSDLRVDGISLMKLEAERFEGGTSDETNFNIEAAYGVLEDGVTIVYRLDGTASMVRGEEAKEIGAVKCAIAVAVVRDPVPSEAVIVQFGRLSAARMAFPYLREAIASTALRLEFPGVLIPAALFGADPQAQERGVESET